MEEKRGRGRPKKEETRGHITARLPLWQVYAIEEQAKKAGVDKTRALEMLLNRAFGMPEETDLLKGIEDRPDQPT